MYDCLFCLQMDNGRWFPSATFHSPGQPVEFDLHRWAGRPARYPAVRRKNERALIARPSERARGLSRLSEETKVLPPRGGQRTSSRWLMFKEIEYNLSFAGVIWVDTLLEKNMGSLRYLPCKFVSRGGQRKPAGAK